MKSGLFFLPFLAVFAGAIGIITGSAFVSLSWAKYVGLGAAIAVIGLWVSLDLDGFRKAFLRKGAKYGASAGIVVVLGILCIVGVAFLTNRPTFNKETDLSKSKANTLADQSKKMIENLESKKVKVEVIAFFGNPNDKQTFSDLIERYRKQANVFDISFYDPKQDPTKAAEYNITSENSVIFKNGNQEARISSFSEEKVTNALAKILKDGSKKIYLLQGHGESQAKGQGPEALSLVVAELENNKFEVAELSLLEKPEIPSDASLVAIIGPKYDYSASEVELLTNYLKSGGALFAAVDAITNVPVLAGFLGSIGLNINEDLLIVPPGDPRGMIYGRTTAFVTKFDDFHPVTRDFSRQRGIALFVPNARTVTTADDNTLSLKPTIVAKTGGDIVDVKDVKSQRDLAQIKQSQVSQGEFGVIGVASGKASSNATENKSEDESAPASKEIRVAVAGSAQFIYDGFTSRATQNLDMFMNIANYLVQEEDFISIKPKDQNTSTIDLSSSWSQLYLLSASFLYPFLFLGGGLIYWLRRRKA